MPTSLCTLLVLASSALVALGELIEQPLTLLPEAQRAQAGYAGVPEHTSGYFKVSSEV